MRKQDCNKQVGCGAVLFCFVLDDSNGASLSCCQSLAEVNLRTASGNFVFETDKQAG
jgi:hypothetical protein